MAALVSTEGVNIDDDLVNSEEGKIRLYYICQKYDKRRLNNMKLTVEVISQGYSVYYYFNFQRNRGLFHDMLNK